MDHEQSEPVQRKAVTYVVMAALLVTLVGGGVVIWRASADSAVELENDLAGVFDDTFGGRADQSWCEGECSVTGHEWHTQGATLLVAEMVAQEARTVGAEGFVESGGTGAALVRISKGPAEIVVGVTDATWYNATTAAAGVSVWFTSVTALDGQESASRIVGSVAP
ncbi:MAG: hypothetical protein JJE47_13235 [Acidimicrobiia bacterium]|nr:hypothetical protein [Acidimicrobiia bacterium]